MLKDTVPNLDVQQTYFALDPSGLRDRIRDLTRQCDLGWRQALAAPLPLGGDAIDKVVIAGMGGSAIAGDLVADLVSLQRTVPILVVRDFHLPFAVNQRTLVLVCSYSGNTDETLSLFHETLNTDAQLMAITGGGLLAEEAETQRVPWVKINVPGEPRSAVGYSLMLLLGILTRFGIATTTQHQVDTARELLQQQICSLAEEVPTGDNPAKQLAIELKDRLVLVYGGGIFSGVARRWKTQLNENAKAWAFFETIPELLHNAVEAYRPSLNISKHLFVLVLQPSAATDPMMMRYHVVVELLQRSHVSHRVLEGINGAPLAQLLSMLVMSDYVSYFLALLNKVDPSPTPTINAGKARLAVLGDTQSQPPGDTLKPAI